MDDQLLRSAIERERQGIDYFCPPSDRAILREMMLEANEKLGVSVQYLAEIDHLDLQGAGTVYADYLEQFSSESVRSYLIPQIVSDRVDHYDDIVLRAYLHFRASGEYISGPEQPAPPSESS